VSAPKRRCGGPFEQVPRRLHSVEDADLERQVDRLGLTGTGHRDIDRDTRAPQSGELGE